MLKKLLLVTLVLLVAALWTAPVFAAPDVTNAPANLWQGDADETETPEGAAMLVLLIGIGAILLVGGAVLTRSPDDPTEAP